MRTGYAQFLSAEIVPPPLRIDQNTYHLCFLSTKIRTASAFYRPKYVPPLPNITTAIRQGCDAKWPVTLAPGLSFRPAGDVISLYRPKVRPMSSRRLCKLNSGETEFTVLVAGQVDLARWSLCTVRQAAQKVVPPPSPPLSLNYYSSAA